MFSSTARVAGWRLAGVVAVIGAFVLASAGIGSAATSGSPYQVQLDPSVQLPITAQGFGTKGSCADIVAAQDDGWHFVVPGGFTAILSLSVSFNSQFRIRYTSDRQQAYVATLPGAQLTQASATVLTLDGEPQVQNLELADTCPATAATATATPTASGSPTATPGPFPSFALPSGFNPFPTALPSWLQSALSNPGGFPVFCTTSATPTASATATASATPSATPTPTPTTTPSATATPSASPSPCEDPAGAFSGANSTSTASATSSASAGSSASASASTTQSSTSSTGTAPTPSPVSGNLPVTG